MTFFYSGTDHRLHTDFAFILGSWKLHLFTKKTDSALAVQLNNCLVLKFLNKYIGFPNNVVEECNDTIKTLEGYYKEGLTEPWI